MRGSARVFAAAAALTALAACEPPFEPIPEPQPRFLVHSVLDVGADTQKVILEQTQFSSGGLTITGAEVKITTPTGRVITLTERLPGPNRPPVYYFVVSNQPESLIPGGTYHLLISTFTADTIRGSTTIPSSTAAVLEDKQPFIFLEDTLRLSWPRVAGAKGYRVLVRSFFESNGQLVPGSLTSEFADTSIVLAGDARSGQNGNYFFPLQETVIVAAVAADDNYYTYYRPGVDPFSGAPPSRLTGGALGVFGSIVPVVLQRFKVR